MAAVCTARTPYGVHRTVQAPRRSARMAYLFMDDESEESWRPEGGENALIVQPGRVPPFIETVGALDGESLIDELFVDLDEVEQSEPPSWKSRLLGAPGWLQGKEFRAGGPWSFFFQLQDLNQVMFGDVGMGYGFLSADEREGRFLWQC